MNKSIDKENILNATFMAMNCALEKLIIVPEFIIVDGNRFINYLNIQSKCIVRGDQKYLNIAAASILAKTHRDKIMQKLSLESPEYGWETNKGYPTKNHRLSIEKHGANKHHRKSFKLLKHQLSLF